MNEQLDNTGRNQAWRVALRTRLKNRERVDIARVRMPQLPPHERVCYQNREVNLGLDTDSARREASRCMDCIEPTCMAGCPVNIQIPLFIKQIDNGDFLAAAQTLKQTSALPAVCGRVCPQEKQCEAGCFYTLKLKKEPVAIGYLEQFAADWERNAGKTSIPQVAAPNGLKVAATGSGPASLAFAGDMAKLGYEVTVFEALHEFGGVLKYGIPEFRLPNSIVDAELDNLRQMGVRFEKNFIVGKLMSFEALKEEGYSAFFVGSGAGLPRFMNISGESANGILSSNEYLTRVNLMHADNAGYDTPVLRGKRVAVIGGGNTAMDSVRTALRLGADKAMLVYRRSREEMPARIEEVLHAEEEGVEFMLLVTPVAYLSDADGRVCAMRLRPMELGAPDASGRRKPVEKVGADFDVPVDLVIVAVGVSPNPLIPAALSGLKTTALGTIEVNPDTMQSSIPEIFAGGDIVRGGATVILAMGDGRRAAAGMHKFLSEKYLTT
ncbi:MAG: NADPH-dependent glutamate synthase [Bacteroidales bacterium]|jgi:glutamate synthase (NADPH/NADH) small chain|nr:NADPH-dependent glutamate synthase [Bacteroidales bacterium]